MPVIAPVLATLALIQAPAPEEVPRYAATRVPEGVPAPTLDGVLDDEAWQHARVMNGMRQTVPVAGAAPSERTEVRVLYDSENVYISLLCLDREPQLIRATQMQRDANLDPDDRVEILIDTFLDRRNAYWFQIGAAGSLGDALITRNGSNFNKEWDGIWDGRARITERGWEAELVIPTRTINFDPKGTAWGLNVRRLIRRRTEEVRWASPDPAIGFFWASNAGTLEGITGLEQGVGLDIRPFALANYENDRLAADDDLFGDVGLDLFWSITPRTKLSASINTDFAETEVDARQVNLTRFPLFLPERRDFFLEDSGIFVFGDSGGRGQQQDVIPFFSRRIGIDPNGEIVPLAVAAKLTSQTESYGLGVLDVQTEATDTLDSENLFVGRFSKNVLSQSDVGVILTSGNPESTGESATYGADFNFRVNDLFGNKNFRFSTWILRTDNQGVADEDLSYAARVSYPNDEVDLALTATVIEDNFDPKLGFVPRSGIKKYDGRFRYRPRLHTDVRRLLFRFDPTVITDTGNELETARVGIQPFGMEFESNDEIGFSIAPTFEALDADFDIIPGVTIPMGDYEFVRYRLFAETSDRRPVSFDVGLSTGTFFDGNRTDFDSVIEWRASRYALFDVEYQWNDVRLPGGDFIVNIGRLRATLLANPEVSWANFLQYDDQTEQVGLNSRLWWILEPGNQFFLVLNQGWDAADGLTATKTDLAFKLGYTFRF